MNDRQSTPDILGNMLTGKAETIQIGKIRTDGGTQMRVALNTDTVDDYADLIYTQPGLSSGWPFDKPIVVYYDGENYWLADGFHRLAAVRKIHKNNDSILIPADIRAGIRRDAILYAAGANSNHGLRRTNADKRRTVETLLGDAEWAQWSDQEISRRCAVDPKTVGNIRREMQPSMEIPEMGARTVQRGGQTYQQNTANIGTNRPARLSEGDLATIVQTWMAGFWRRPWPENPSHTNGTLWMELTAWMHENVQQPWQESDLTTVIKRLHYEYNQQWSTPNRPVTPANRPTPQPDEPVFAAVMDLQGAVNRVWNALNPTNDPAIDKELGQVGRQAIVNKGGDFWERCKAEIEKHFRAWRHQDMRQAMANVIKRKESGFVWSPSSASSLTARMPEPFVPTPNKPEPGVWVPPTLAEINARPRVTGALDLQSNIDMCWDLQYGKVADPITAKANIKQARYEADHQGRFFVFCHESADDELRPFTDNTLTLAIQIYCDKLEAPLRQSSPELFPAATWRSADEEEGEETIDPADFGIAEPDGDPDEAPVPELVEGRSSLLLRRQQLEDLRDQLIEALAAIREAGELTGKHTVTLGADRELRRVIELLDNELNAILKGATHEYA